MCRTGMGSSMMLKIKVEKLIDKKGYRDKIFFQEKGCGFKKYMYFCAVKMTKRNDRFFSSFLHPPNSSSTEIYPQK